MNKPDDAARALGELEKIKPDGADTTSEHP
jgi:hypothetical protein